MKKIKYFFEILAIAPLYALFALLPLAISRPICAFVARTLGPCLPVSRVALENLRAAFPENSALQNHHILRDCWDNLGRVVAEFPHVPKLLKDPKNFRVENADILESVLAQKKACIFFTAHMANWEISYVDFLRRHLNINLIASRHNNPLIEWLLMRGRSKQSITMISRTVEGSKQLLRAIQNQEFIGALLDQYASDGVFLPFFQRPAKTTLALARMAARYNLPFLPVQVRRIGKKSRFILTYTPSIEIDPALSLQENAEALMLETNRRMEDWIRQEPGQWLWLHRKWKVKPRDRAAFAQSQTKLPF